VSQQPLQSPRRDLRLEFERHALPVASALYRTARRLTRGRDEAEDVVQETFLRAYRTFAGFQPGTNAKACGSISGYRIAVNGRLELLRDDGRTGNTGDGSSPIDLAFSGGGHFLCSLNGGTRTIGAFRMLPDGSLRALPFSTGLPPGANGLAAR
jgi:RNA polymerase sigma-70 factor (ECF subfamily)